MVEETTGQILVAKVFDKDNAANDDPLGRYSFLVTSIGFIKINPFILSDTFNVLLAFPICIKEFECRTCET